MNAITNLNEQLIGKFHVKNVDKFVNSDENVQQQQQDETGCASRFQMIRVDRNFGRGRWKVNDFEPPETTLNSTTNSNENETTNVQIPVSSATITSESNVTQPVIPTTTHFQRRFSVNGTLPIVPTATGIIHSYTTAAAPPPPPSTIPNQSYLLSNHPHQFGYYPFYPPPYSPYAPPWAAALAPSNPYLPGPALPPPPNLPQISTTLNQNDLNQLSDNGIGINSDNTYPNPSNDPLQNAHLSAYLYALQQAHSPYLPQTSSSVSTYATIPSYHPIAPAYPTILPPKTLLSSQTNNQNHHSIDTQQIPLLHSPKSVSTKLLLQPSSLITPKTETIRTNQIPDLISSSPAPPSLISPIIATSTYPSTTSLNDIWTYTTAGSPLNLTQTAATAVAAMELLNTKTSSNNEIANEFFKELTTPIKPNNTTDIDNKISAAMDLVKMHLLSAVREEVTELREQIRSLNEKISQIDHENIFLRQHVSSDIYAQYIPIHNGFSSSSNDSSNSTINHPTSSHSHTTTNSM